MFLISEDILLWNGQFTFLNFTFVIMLVILFSNLAISSIGGGVRFELNPKVSLVPLLHLSGLG